MEIIGIIISLTINIAILMFIFWIINSIKNLKEQINNTTNIKIKNLWATIDRLKDRIRELEDKNKNTPE